MSLASIHYLSMNVRNGNVAPSGTVTATVNATFNLSRLNPATLYSVNWGDTAPYGAVATVNITNKELTSNVATLTAAAHGYIAGQTITVSGMVDTVFNGTFLLTAVTTNTFSFAKTNANVTSAAVSAGTASTPLTDANGAVAKTHTYATAGTYTVQIIDASGGASNGSVAARATVTVV